MVCMLKLCFQNKHSPVLKNEVNTLREYSVPENAPQNPLWFLGDLFDTGINQA